MASDDPREADLIARFVAGEVEVQRTPRQRRVGRRPKASNPLPCGGIQTEAQAAEHAAVTAALGPLDRGPNPLDAQITHLLVETAVDPP